MFLFNEWKFYGGEILCPVQLFLKGLLCVKDPGVKETEHSLCVLYFDGFGIFPLQPNAKISNKK